MMCKEQVEYSNWMVALQCNYCKKVSLDAHVEHCYKCGNTGDHCLDWSNRVVYRHIRIITSRKEGWWIFSKVKTSVNTKTQLWDSVGFDKNLKKNIGESDE